MFCKKDAVKNSSKLTGKQSVSETLFNKVAGVQSATLSETRFQHRCFPMNFEKILGTLIFNTNYERLLLLFVILSSAVKLFSTFGFFSPFLTIRTSCPEVFLGKAVLKICSKFTGEHPCRSVIWIKLPARTSAWMFSCKFAAYFQNIFS